MVSLYISIARFCPSGDAMSRASRDGNDPIIGERGQLVWTPIVSQPRFSGKRRSCHAQRGSSEGKVPGPFPRSDSSNLGLLRLGDAEFLLARSSISVCLFLES